VDDGWFPDEKAMNSDGSQDAVFAFLGDPATHDDVTPVRFDTHASVVFLAGDRALKIKRAVRFPFLDYSTLAKRKAACEAELAVNRRFAPQIYRRTVAITREVGGGLALDGKGEPVEWAVEMLRFDESQTLDHLADRGALDPGLPEKLAVAVAAMHRDAEPVAPAPWIEAISQYVEQNTQAFRECEDVFPVKDVAELDARSRAAFERLRSLLVTRGEKGLIRRGHGDLHLGNVVVLEGEPVAFDAIEFDPVVASGDVLYDLAFLLMDLVERDLTGAANTVLNGYFAASRRDDDCDGIAALPFFMSLRAAIRAKVTAARIEADAKDSKNLAQEARRYFDLALELLAPGTPRVIGVGGLSGAGKSVLARDLAAFVPPLPGALVLRSDVERKAMFDVGETEPLPKQAYEPEVSQRLYARLMEKAARVARAGHSVVVDAVFARSDERQDVEAAARAADVPFLGFFLTADLDIRLQRVGARRNDASDAGPDVARSQEDYALGVMTWNVVDASGSPAQTLDKVRSLL
jgi:aminoglycoside phosphotransferase family enzyme/predicted kinase